MKRSILFFLTGFAAIGLFFENAHAISFIDTVAFGKKYMHDSGFCGKGDRVGFDFNIKKGGFDPDIHELVSAELTLSLKDDSKTDVLELALMIIGRNDRFFWEVDSGDILFSLSSSVLRLLNTTGRLDGIMMAQWGDFFLNSATLTAETTTPAPVPEPSTMFLLGLGLVGVGVFMRQGPVLGC